MGAGILRPDDIRYRQSDFIEALWFKPAFLHISSLIAHRPAFMVLCVDPTKKEGNSNILNPHNMQFPNERVDNLEADKNRRRKQF